jgi:S-DNA-T family DNA segregation ATPase FtsK/SpoIIIE
MTARENKYKNDFAKEKEVKEPDAREKTRSAFRFVTFRDERARKIFGVFLLLVSVYLFIAFTSFLFTWKADQSVVMASGWRDFFRTNPDAAENWLGIVGAIVSHLFIHSWFGIASYIFVLLSFLFGIKILFHTELLPIRKTIQYSFFGVIWFSTTLGFLFNKTIYLLGGAFGHQSYLWLKGLLGAVGMPVFLAFYLLVFLIAVFNIPIFNPFTPKKVAIAESETESGGMVTEDPSIAMMQDKEEEEIGSLDNIELVLKADEPPVPEPVEQEPEIEKVEFTFEPVVTGNREKPVYQEIGLVIENPVTEEEPVNVTPREHFTIDTPFDPTLDLSTYQFPPLELLVDHGEKKAKVDTQELEENKNLIIETLKNYNIGISQIKATIGPTVTLYEIVPMAGIRIAKIKSLEDDIALSLAALGIRIIAPIPGKGTIGIEVPNQKPEVVSMRSVLASPKFQNTDYDLPIALGKTISNEVYVADLSKMPHLLMAGATGQGKSVGLNAILISLLYKKHPSQLKFVLVDPKKVELTLYKTIERHFLAKIPGEAEAIIVDTKLVVNTLNSLCIEMDHRYELLKDAQVRNLKEYNAKFITRRLNPNEGHKFLPYIVVVIDELADLMMTAGKEVELPIARLAQLARAIGIHLVLATQRPSVNIITGTIKANFPARLAFKVTSKIDSRTILDANGADQLIGKGDMLISTGNDLTRIQCAFVDLPEVEKVTEFIGSQRGYSQAMQLPEFVDETSSKDTAEFDSSNRDALFEEAARIIVQHQQGSTSLLQRRLKLGYNRAGRLIDQLEHAGVVGPFEGSKAREVKIMDESHLEQFLKTLDK